MSWSNRTIARRTLSRLPALLGLQALYTYTHLRHPSNSSLAHGLRRASWFRRSLFIRHLDTGSSNGAEQSINALQNAAYDMRRHGFQIVESPRRADVLLITGAMTLNLVDATLATFDAMPEQPRYIITVGDDTEDGGIFRNSYATLGQLPHPLMLDPQHHIGHVSGIAPRPDQVLAELTTSTYSLQYIE